MIRQTAASFREWQGHYPGGPRGPLDATIVEWTTAALERLEILRYAFRALPESEALRECDELVQLLVEGTFQYEMADMLVRAGIDSTAWTRFVVNTTRATHADAMALLQEACFRAKHRSLPRSQRTHDSSIKGNAGPARAKDYVSAGPHWPRIMDLVSVAHISTDTFGRIRREAGLQTRLRGGAASMERFSPEKVEKLIRAVQSGNFRNTSKIAVAWKNLVADDQTDAAISPQ